MALDPGFVRSVIPVEKGPNRNYTASLASLIAAIARFRLLGLMHSLQCKGLHRLWRITPQRCQAGDTGLFVPTEWKIFETERALATLVKVRT